MLIYGGRGSNGRFLSDTWIYNLDDATWVQVRNASGTIAIHHETPSPRVFAACVSLKRERNVNNADLSVTRMYRRAYEDYSSSQGGTGTPKTASKCVPTSMPGMINHVYMFGGTDGSDALSDLWVFKGHMGEMYWEQIISVGTSPAARYGHRMLYDPRTDNILVLGK